MEDSKNESGLKFYTSNEVAEMLKMNVQVIARKLQHGEIPGYKIGKDWRVRESDLLAWLEKHSNKYVMNPAEKIVNRFMKGGKFETLPVQRKKRIYVLEHILEQFDLNKVYTETEVNDIITPFHDDYCRVRREFVDERMMLRKAGKYRRNAAYRIKYKNAV
jgi:excisionase family DNA binding protein